MRCLSGSAILLASGATLVAANVAFDNSFVPLSYGECTNPFLDETGPPYSGVNSDPWIAEGVGSGSWGNTCYFGSPTSQATVFSMMPQLYQDGFHAAMSQDPYNGMHIADWGTATSSGGECYYQDYTEAQMTSGQMCGWSCGVCFAVNGPLGQATFLVNEIADVPAVGQNGEGLNLHLPINPTNYNGQVRGNGGVRKDIQYRRVPCPVESGIMFSYEPTAFNWWAHIYFRPFHFRIGVKAMYAKPTYDSTWIAMPRSWTNRFIWAPGEGIVTQSGKAFIYGDSSQNPNLTWDFKIVSQQDQELICYEVGPWGTSEEILYCRDQAGNPQQFDDMDGVGDGYCDDEPAADCEADGDWQQTGPGETIELPCPYGYSGVQMRTCGTDGIWGDVDMGYCTPAICFADGDWPDTDITATASIACPSGYTGMMYRECDEAGNWGDVDMGSCVMVASFCSADGDWPETDITATAYLPCPAGYDGTMSRECYVGGFWGDIDMGNCMPLCPALLGATLANVEYWLAELQELLGGPTPVRPGSDTCEFPESDVTSTTAEGYLQQAEDDMAYGLGLLGYW